MSKNTIINLPSVGQDIIELEAQSLFQDILACNEKTTSARRTLIIPLVISSQNETILMKKGYEVSYFINKSIGKSNGLIYTHISWNALSKHDSTSSSKDVSEITESLKNTLSINNE